MYGTLRRGQCNHLRYCHAASHIEPATVVGRLFALPAGYPMLAIPPECILAHGTADPLADARLQQSMLIQSAANLADSPPRASENANPGWEIIEGEIMVLNDPARYLPPLDSLESFCPGKDSLYWRVLIHLASGPQTPAWTYVAPESQLPPGARRIGSSWPSCGSVSD